MCLDTKTPGFWSLRDRIAVLQLYEHVCDERECTDIGCGNPDIPGAVLLKPAEYEIVDEAKLPELVKLLSAGQLLGSPVGGLTFGVHVPEVKHRGLRVSYPSGPTWQVEPCTFMGKKTRFSHQAATPLALVDAFKFT